MAKFSKICNRPPPHFPVPKSSNVNGLDFDVFAYFAVLLTPSFEYSFITGKLF